MSKISTMDAIRAAVARYDAYYANPGAPKDSTRGLACIPDRASTRDNIALARGIVELHERLARLEANGGATTVVAREGATANELQRLLLRSETCPLPTEEPTKDELNAAWEKLRKRQATAGDCHVICDLSLETLRAMASGPPSYEPGRYTDAEVKLARALIITSALALDPRP